MRPREYLRVCKECGKEFVVSTASLDLDRLVGLADPEYCPADLAKREKSCSGIACHYYDIEETEYGRRLLLDSERANAIGNKVDLGAGGLGRLETVGHPFEEGGNNEPVEKIFPISEVDDRIIDDLENYQVIVLVGTTGSGKSTHVPQMLVNSKWARRGPIVVTQPRIQATRQIPEFVARLNDSSHGPGAEVGFTHSRANHYDARTRLLFMTDGKLINDIISGKVAEYSVIMIDEAHERSVNIDLILALMKPLLNEYPHLRLIIASATIDESSFISYFGGRDRVPYIFSKAPTFPVKPHYWGKNEPGDIGTTWQDWWKKVRGGVQPQRASLPEAIADLVQFICKQTGDHQADGPERSDHILVFLQGAREIDRTVSAVKARNIGNLLALPLYAKRSLDEQQRALKPTSKKDKKKRRVIVSTNVAETSLTIDGIAYVIDSGYIKEATWNPKTCVQKVQTIRHSKSGCRQRYGRAGRKAPGDAFMFYTEEQFESFPDDTSPDIARSDMEQVILSALSAGVSARDLSWMPLDRQDQERFDEEIDRAIKSLKARGAIDEYGYITSVGLELRRIPSDLDVATVFMQGEQFALGVEVATLLPFLKLFNGIQSLLLWDKEWDTYKKLKVRAQHAALFEGCGDDLDLFLKLWMLWDNMSSEEERENWCSKRGVDHTSFKELIVDERDKLLGGLMDRKKADERTILVNKINALRLLMADCLEDDIYISPGDDEKKAVEHQQLDWEFYYTGTDYYEEQEDDFYFDPLSGPSAEQAGSGVFKRLKGSAKAGSKALIEIAPISICYKKDAPAPFIACQSRANFVRPSRTDVLGLTIVSLEPEWLALPRESTVERCLAYSSLSMEFNGEEEQSYKTRLFAPLSAQLQTIMEGTVTSWEPGRGGGVTFRVNHGLPSLLGSEKIEIKGWVDSKDVEKTITARMTPGNQVFFVIIGYDHDENGELVLKLSLKRPREEAFAEFSRLFKEGSEIKVEMVQVFQDPLGRSPLFIVREPKTGLQIPMSGEDYCGNTLAQPYFGLRFSALEHERFKVHIADINKKEGQVTLSRGRQLLEEYAGVKNRHDFVDTFRVLRTDNLGAYLLLGRSNKPYVTLVRRALWPEGFSPSPNAQVKGKLRFNERGIDAGKWAETLKKGEGQPPDEMDLGIEIDLRAPAEHERFFEKHVIGELMEVKVDRVLDSGNLLVDLLGGLKGMIYADELGLDNDGNLKKAHDYLPNQKLAVRITRRNDERASIGCSIFRFTALPVHIEKGQVVEARVLLVKNANNDPLTRYITCSIQNKYRIQVRSDDPGIDIEIGDTRQVQVNIVNDRTAELKGMFVDEEKGSGSNEIE